MRAPGPAFDVDVFPSWTLKRPILVVRQLGLAFHPVLDAVFFLAIVAILMNRYSIPPVLRSMTILARSLAQNRNIHYTVPQAAVSLHGSVGLALQPADWV